MDKQQLLCPKCNRPDIQFVLVGFMCRHEDCQHFFAPKEVQEAAVNFLVERYTGDNPENKPGQDVNVEDYDPTVTNN